MVHKVTGYLILLGLILAGIGTGFHPLTINPWNGSSELQKAAGEDHWMIDHTIMVIAVVLWLVGMIMAAKLISKDKVQSTVSMLLFGVALTIWLIVLGMELTIFPAVFKQLTDKTHYVVGSLFFGYGLLSGYIAMIVIWIGTGCLSLTIKNAAIFSKSFYLIGVIASVIGMLGTIVTILAPNTILLGVSTIFPTGWVILLAIKLIKYRNDGGQDEGKFT